MGLFKSKNTQKVSTAPADSTAPEATVGISQPQTLANPPTRIDKGEFILEKYDEIDHGPMNIHYIMQENIALPVGESPVAQSGDPKEIPWDVVVIMTTKGLLMARPRPPTTKQNAEYQAEDLWKQVVKLFEDDNLHYDNNQNEIHTMICWILFPVDGDGFSLRLSTDIRPIQVKERMEIYTRIFRDGAKKLCRPLKFIYRGYVLGKGPGPGRTESHQSQIVVHGHNTFEGVSEYHALKNTTDYDSYLQSQYKRLQFPPISAMAQQSSRDVFRRQVVTTDLEKSRLLWYDGPCYL
jgi:hypothetical protein